MMEGKKHSGHKRGDKLSKKQKRKGRRKRPREVDKWDEPPKKQNRIGRRKRSREEDEGDETPKKSKVDHQQQISEDKQKEDNKVNEQLEELEVDPYALVPDHQQQISEDKQKEDNKVNEQSKELEVDPNALVPDHKQQISEDKQKEDNKVNEQSEELEVDPVALVPEVEAFVGCGCSINNRHSKQLESLSALMSAKRHPLEITDDKNRVLKVPGCSNGLYMEWSKKDDQYFLWGSTAEGKQQIKFEFHGGFDPSANILEVKKPMLAFSELFDFNSGWTEVKKMLQELFGHVDGEVIDGGYDYMLAFTRIGEMLHFRVFKFHTQPSSDMKSLRLEEVSPSFILKPLEIHRSGDDSTEGVSVEKFMDEDGLMPDMKSGLNLVSCSMLYDDSYQYMAPHAMQPAVSHKVVLPLPAKNLQWLGFNTSCQEFFERYHAYRTTLVPGTGPHPTLTVDSPTASSATPVHYDHITVPMKVFGRGLIICVKQIQRYGCLSDFNERHIFLRRGKVLILGVKLLPYSEEQAKKNFFTVHAIILQAIHGMVIPRDLQFVLDLLVKDPIENYDTIVNNFAWMVAQRRDNMVSELNDEFSELPPDVQASMSETFPEMDKWLSKYANNRLLYAVLIDKLSKTKVTDLAALQAHFESKAAKDQKKAVDDDNRIEKLTDSNRIQDPNYKIQLFMGRKYFKGVRNSYAHVSRTYLLENMIGLPTEIVDLVVSSEFAALCSFVQVKVPTAFKATDERKASLERFRDYFSGPEDVEFEDADEK